MFLWYKNDISESLDIKVERYNKRNLDILTNFFQEIDVINTCIINLKTERKSFSDQIYKEIEPLHLKLGTFQDQEIEEALETAFNKNLSQFKMKCEHVLSKWKENMIDKMENITKYENELLIGAGIYY
jgi:K+ transporter